jgi:HAD superfamily hydrolase (TIGR01509 family)
LIHRDGIDTIFFDLDGTLRQNRPTFIEALTTYSQELGLPNKDENNRQAHRWLNYYWAQSPELISDQETFNNNDDLFWINHSRLYLLAYGCQPKQAVQLAPGLTHCMRESYKPDDIVSDQVPDLLENLKTSGFRLAVISNRRNPFDEQLEALGICSYFEYSLAAGDINAWKPDPTIFQHALAAMEIDPGQAIYVGDNYFADVIGAQRAGIQAVLIDPEGLFPEADCPVIHKISELELVLDQ